MNVERLRQAMKLFEEVCDLPPAQSADALARHCGDDEEVRAYVEQMLARDRDSSGAIGNQQPGAGVNLLAQELAVDDGNDLPDDIAGYRILQVIGRGGMGIVYEAEQSNPRRRVALKVIRYDLVTPSVVRRFRYEAQTLAHLDHPGIAHIYEAGTTNAYGRTQPFFAMEYIDGLPLDQHVKEQHLSSREILELVARSCDAVQHAHQKGVVHRDLKPANILVKQSLTTSDGSSGSSTQTDALGQPKVLDFGVARVTNPDLQMVTIQTLPGQIFGTLAYMSPEQIVGDSDIDARTDVYSLGVVLYELLSGKRPFDLAGKPMIEAARVVREDDATQLSTIAPALKGDVATIVAKAIEKERDRRYASAADLAADIRHYLRNEPISARPASTLYHLLKFSRRNRALVVGFATTMVVLVVGSVVSTWGWVVATNLRKSESNARAALQEEAADLEQLVQFQNDLLRTLDATQLGQEMRAKTIEAARIAAGPTLGEDALQELEALLARTDFSGVANAAVITKIISDARKMIDEQHRERPRAQAKMLRSLYPFLPGDAAKTALKVARDLYEIELATLGPDHRDTLSAKALVCQVLGRLRRDEECEVLSRETYDSYHRLYGPNDADTLNFLITYAQMLYYSGDIDGTKKAYRRCFEAYQQGLPIDRETAIEARRRWAWHLVGEEGWDRALPFLEEGLATAKADDVVDEYDAYARSFLSEAYLELGRGEEAIAIAEEGLQIREGLLAKPNFGTLVVGKRLIRALDAAGRMHEALPCLREQVALYQLLHGERDSFTLVAFLQLGRWLALRGRHEEAIPTLRKAVEIGASLATPGERSWGTSEGRDLLSWSLKATGRPSSHRVENGTERWRFGATTHEKNRNYEQALSNLYLLYLSQRSELGAQHTETLQAHRDLRQFWQRLGFSSAGYSKELRTLLDDGPEPAASETQAEDGSAPRD